MNRKLLAEKCALAAAVLEQEPVNVSDIHSALVYVSPLQVGDVLTILRRLDRDFYGWEYMRRDDKILLLCFLSAMYSR